MHFTEFRRFSIDMCKTWEFWKMHIWEELHPKVLKFCTQASINETFMCATLQVEIQKNILIDKLPLTGKNSLKIQYLGINLPRAADI